jgi:2-polyprenyl-6-methoxyphenol hydroxylase-like FAD-dependent oxidoreductase
VILLRRSAGSAKERSSGILLPVTGATSTDVLVCGAGPTGLVLALWLARSGIRVRIVDAAAEPGTTSRALVVHARTLELHRQVGIADAVVERVCASPR